MEGPYHVLSVRSVTTSSSGAPPVLTARVNKVDPVTVAPLASCGWRHHGYKVQRNGSRPVLCVSLQTVISLRSFSRRGTAAKPVLNGRRISPSYFRLCVSVRSYTGLKLDGGLSRSHAGPAAVPPEPTRCTAALVSLAPNETLWNISPRSRGSLRLDAGELDHLGPLLGSFGDQLTEVGGRARKRRAAQVGKLRLDFRVGERGINLPVELV